MKLFALTMGLVAECCYWEGVKSGRYLECKPDHYMKGACESGSRNDCNIDNGIIGGSSFGIKCCPTTKDLDFAERDECQWFGGASGDNVSCPNGTAAFGRCSTSARSGSGGDCNNLSHQVQCCQSVTTINELTCGWIYASYGVKKECPTGLVIAGFCGVNNKNDCKNKTFVGIRCCSQ